MRISMVRCGLAVLLVIWVTQSAASGAGGSLRLLAPPRSHQPVRKPPAVQDPELEKIRQALQAAKDNKAAAMPRIGDIQNVVKNGLATLDACPAKTEYYPTSAPLVTPSGSGVLIGCYASTCPMYSKCAEDYQASSGRLLDRVTKIQSSAAAMRDDVAAQCRGEGITAAMKTYYRDSFSAYQTEASGFPRKFGDVITEITKLADRYPSCSNHGNVTEWQ